MTELASIFVELGLTQYLDTFIEQGFDTWDTILDITESDFDALGVKLGHRRKLQRKIANSRGLSAERSIASPKRRATSIDLHADELRDASGKAEPKDGASTTGKRKYRRHPKPDENAPERPPSAYVIFSNKMREDLKGRHLSFTEIAKLVGENWQNLSSAEKEPYEAQAFGAKEKYNAELADYKKTESYRKYSEYLADFKAKHSNQQPGTSRLSEDTSTPESGLTSSATDLVKRPKLENNTSTGSTGTGSSSTSQHGYDANRMRVDSIGSWNGQPTGEYPPSGLPHLPGLVIGHGHHHMSQPSQSSPTALSNAPLPGYRDIVIGSSQPQTLPWRESPSEMSNHTASRRPSGPTLSQSPMESHSGLLTHHHYRRGTGNTPPLLTSESTIASNASSGSQGSGYYGPRTPLEPSIDRAPHIPSLYPSKASGPHDMSLTAIRAPSLSPQTSLNTSYSSPTSMVTMEYPNVNPRRNYLPPMQHNGSIPAQMNGGPHSRAISGPQMEEVLDPVSALLKAGEIVNSGSRNRQ